MAWLDGFINLKTKPSTQAETPSFFVLEISENLNPRYAKIKYLKHCNQCSI